MVIGGTSLVKKMRIALFIGWIISVIILLICVGVWVYLGDLYYYPFWYRLTQVGAIGFIYTGFAFGCSELIDLQ